MSQRASLSSGGRQTPDYSDLQTTTFYCCCCFCFCCVQGGGNGTMLDPYITRAAGIARLGGTTGTILISDGGRLGDKGGDLSTSAAIKPGFTAVIDYTDPPTLNLRVQQLAAGYRYTCGQELNTKRLRCWGQRPDFVTASPPFETILGAFAVSKYHYCYQVSTHCIDLEAVAAAAFA